jgi:hypothetical protein
MTHITEIYKCPIATKQYIVIIVNYLDLFLLCELSELIFFDII